MEEKNEDFEGIKDESTEITDEKFMNLAIKEGMKAYDLLEVPIGALIVYDDRIIGKGYNRRNTDKSTFAHAELIAMKQAMDVIGDWRLEDTTMYVTLEPCPMCAGAIVQARIPKVVIGAPNLKAGSGGTIVNLLEEPRFNHQVEVVRDVLLEECSQMLKNFFRELRQQKKKIKEENKGESK